MQYSKVWDGLAYTPTIRVIILYFPSSSNKQSGGAEMPSHSVYVQNLSPENPTEYLAHDRLGDTTISLDIYQFYNFF